MYLFNYHAYFNFNALEVKQINTQPRHCVSCCWMEQQSNFIANIQLNISIYIGVVSFFFGIRTYYLLCHIF